MKKLGYQKKASLITKNLTCLIAPTLLLSGCITPSTWKGYTAEKPTAATCLDPIQDMSGLQTWITFDDYANINDYINGNIAAPISDEVTGTAVTLIRPPGTIQLELIGAPYQGAGMKFGANASNHPDFQNDKSGYMQIHNHIGLDFGMNTDFTIDFWYLEHGCAGPVSGLRGLPCQVEDLVVSQGPDASNNHLWQILSTPDGLTFKSHGNGTKSVSFIPVLEDAWTHYAFVYDRDGDLNTYVNGNLHRTDSMTNNSPNFRSGRDIIVNGVHDSSQSGGPSSGRVIFDLDEFEVFNRAITGAEVRDIYEGKCRPAREISTDS
ncbi:LamG domain-containing protein [Hellea sp.]|nr:LamG domain-containing protein [Hellea sp.]